MLQEKRTSLENKYKLKETSHAQRFASGSLSESAYQDSCRELNAIYEELAAVCEELGDPIPLRA